MVSQRLRSAVAVEEGRRSRVLYLTYRQLRRRDLRRRVLTALGVRGRHGAPADR